MPKPIIIGLLLTCLFSSAKGQTLKSYVAEVNAYTTRIDSLAKDHDHDLTIAEGPISQRITKVFNNTTTGKYDTIVNTETIGGFSKQIFTLGDTILRILYHDNIDNNIYETFYFRDKQLICAKVRLEANGIGNMRYSGIEYYRGGIRVYTKSPPTKAKKKYRSRVVFSWWDTGTGYYQEYWQRSN